MEKNKIDKRKQGKRNRQAGSRFELKVRKDLESKGWIVSKWMNTVEFSETELKDTIDKVTRKEKEGLKFIPGESEIIKGKLIPAKRKYNPFKKALGIGTGFPDFNAHKKDTVTSFKTGWLTDNFPKEETTSWGHATTYFVIGVEARSDGYLTREEKEMCRWYLSQHIFSKIYIAKKGTKRGQIVYTEFLDHEFPKTQNKIRKASEKTKISHLQDGRM